MQHMQFAMELRGKKFEDIMSSMMSILSTSTKDTPWFSSNAVAKLSRYYILSVKVALSRAIAMELIAILLSLVA